MILILQVLLSGLLALVGLVIFGHSYLLLIRSVRTRKSKILSLFLMPMAFLVLSAFAGQIGFFLLLIFQRVYGGVFGSVAGGGSQTEAVTRILAFLSLGVGWAASGMAIRLYVLRRIRSSEAAEGD